MKHAKELDFFCENIRSLRAQYGLSRKQMAAILRIHVKTLEKLERGIIPPRMRVDVLIRASWIFDVKPSALLCPMHTAPEDKAASP